MRLKQPKVARVSTVKCGRAAVRRQLFERQMGAKLSLLEAKRVNSHSAHANAAVDIGEGARLWDSLHMHVPVLDQPGYMGTCWRLNCTNGVRMLGGKVNG